MSKVKITETVLRDAHQSLVATRMTTEDMLPILEAMDKVGYHSLEAWGGATFDACLRFLDEDPWVRLRVIRDKVKNTKLQMLYRGQNILGYRHYPDDVVEYFVQKSIANGIDIIRIFDALNDARNLKTSINAAKKEGGHVQAAICYTTGPVYDTEYFVKYAKVLEEMGADSICIKDMAALIKPYDAYNLVKALKENVKLPVAVHTHNTSGLATMAILKSVEAGADIVDTAISPFASGTSHPATESIVATLEGTEYDTGLKTSDLEPLTEHFSVLREKYIKEGLLNPKILKVDVKTLMYQVPGGMLSNLISQLKAQGKEDKFEDVLAEVPRVRAEAGYPPLVTPSSQIVGTQAVLNVISGERYKLVSKEFRGLIRGEYGKTPVDIDPEFRKSIIGNSDEITVRPADLIPPELESIRRAAARYAEKEEDVLSYALFEQVAAKFFENRMNKKYAVDGKNSDKTNLIHPVT